MYIIYGGLRIDWNLICSTAKAISNNRTFNNTLFNVNLLLHQFNELTGSHIAPNAGPEERLLYSHALVINMVRASQDRPYSLSDLLYMCRSFTAGDARDRVFAIIALSRDSSKLLPFIDYRKKDEEVFLDTAHFILTTSDWADVLYNAGLRYRSLPTTDPERKLK